MNRSRQKAYLTGMNGSYSTDNVKGMNELADTNGFNGSSTSGYVGTYNMAYRGGMTGNMLLGQPDYKNQNNMLHNNVGERVLMEQVMDYKLIIDASLKDYSRKPEPFKFVVKFNGIEPKKKDISYTYNNITYSYPKYVADDIVEEIIDKKTGEVIDTITTAGFIGDTDVVIDRVFKNIKSICINSLIMPKYISYITDSSSSDIGGYVSDGVKLAKSNYKYLLLKIDELENNRCFSNNKAYGNQSFIMKLDDDLCCHNNIWVPISNSMIIYPDSNLMTLSRLTVEICDDKGNRLYPTLDGNKHDFFNEYQTLIDTQIKSNSPPTLSIINRLNSLKEITDHISPELCLSLNIVTAQINTNTQYRQ